MGKDQAMVPSMSATTAAKLQMSGLLTRCESVPRGNDNTLQSCLGGAARQEE